MRSLFPFLTVALMLTANISKADNPLSLSPKDSTKKSLIVSIVPQYTLHNGFRLDFEARLSKQHWLMIAPIYYMGNKRSLFSNNSDQNYELEGYGAEIYDKIFLKKTTKPFGPYLALGLKYHHFSLKYEDYTWEKYTDGGLEYYDYVYKTVEESIERYGVNLLFGYQQNLFAENMHLDFFVGYGLKISEVTLSDDTKDEVFTTRFWDYGYSGPHLLLGVRLGVVF